MKDNMFGSAYYKPKEEPEVENWEAIRQLNEALYGMSYVPKQRPRPTASELAARQRRIDEFARDCLPLGGSWFSNEDIEAMRKPGSWIPIEKVTEKEPFTSTLVMFLVWICGFSMGVLATLALLYGG